MRSGMGWAVIVAIVAVACGGSASSGGSGSGGSGTGTGTATGTGTGSSLCPAAPPAAGSSCEPPAEPSFDVAHCTWGDDPRPDCRTRGLCNQDGTWTITEPSAAFCDEPPLPAACETTPPASASTCADSSLSCWYGDGTRCWCSECEGGSPYPVCQTIDPPEWACASPPAGCPSVIPQAGDGCSDEGLSCGPDCELQVLCEGGAWVWKQGDCPICASPTTPVATPRGEVAIAALRVGDLVYSVDGEGVAVVPIRRVGSTAVTRHRVLRLLLDGGARLEMSPGHPTADGRTFADLFAGDRLDGQTIVERELVPYDHARTHDILPDSTSGAYVAAGVWVGSTLKR